MFFHNFKYTLKILLKKKALIFWTLLFPLALATFFYMAFSDIENNSKLDVFNIAIVQNDQFEKNVIYKEIFKNLSSKENKDRLFNIKYVSSKKADQLLNDNKIEGYLIFNEDIPKVVVSKSGINQTILKYVVEEISSIESITNNVVSEKIKDELKNNYQIDSEKIYKDVLNSVNNNEVKLNNISNKNLSYTVIEFYTLIAMTCLYGGMISMITINECLPNISSKGKRIAVSKAKKSSIILSGLLSSYLIQLFGTLLLFLYTTLVLKINYGNNLALIILLALVGNLAGLSLGVFVATVFKTNENLKTGIILGISMIGSFLAGMMGMTMKYVIDKGAPIINKLNPVGMITDGYYSLYYYTTFNRYTFDLISLLTFSLVLLIISFFILRRQKYDSV